MKLKDICHKLYKPFQKMAAMIVMFSMLVVLTSCGSDFEGHVDTAIDYDKMNGSAGTHKIGVSMPTKDLQRWTQDGENMEQILRKSGFIVDIQYANNETALQCEQIDDMISSGCDVLVIASIDGTKLTESLQAAKEAGIVVIAYDRLIMGSDAVSYYASFDNQMVGKLQGEYIEKALDLKNAKGPFHIELFTGSPDDNNCNFFFGGAMEVLQPYIDEGKLVVPSGQTSQEECSTKEWSSDIATARMNQILKNHYNKGQKLDAVLSSNDSVANGIIKALSANYKGDNPVLTGQDCDVSAVKAILNGKQSMSIFKDTRVLAEKVAEMVTAVINEEEVPVNDTSSYDNGTGIIPSFLCEPVFADADNYKEVLIDSGYYTKDQIK